MSAVVLTLERWDHLSRDGREMWARRLAAELPTPFHFASLRSQELGDQRHEVAFFDHQGAEFALIPGGHATLGYDPERPFLPTAAQRTSWEDTAEEDGSAEPLDATLTRVMTPLRTVTLDPFLLEVRASEAGVELLPTETPAIRELAIHAGPGHTVERYAGPGDHIRVMKEQDGRVRGYRVTWKTHREAADDLDRQGFRLPTSDEWEYACRAGSRSFFRWGNDCPTDHYPVGDLLVKVSDQDVQRRPNAFGLRIAADPYNWEFVAEPDVLRGGDGGGAICGGEGFFAGWLPLASAYAIEAGRFYRGKPVPGAHARRLYQLA